MLEISNINPGILFTFDNEILGITIVSDSSTDGDALSTSVFAMGVTEGMKFVNSIDGIDAIFITKDNKVYITNGLKDIFTLNNTDFTLEN